MSSSVDRFDVARWIIVGGVGLFICGYVYMNLDQFIDYQGPHQSSNETKLKIDSKVDSKEEEKEENKEVDNTPKFPVQVFVRMRPLVGNELIEKHLSIEYKVKKNKKKQTDSLILQKVCGRNDERDKKFTGFKHVLLPTQSNESVFNKCILPMCIPSIFNGERICTFAYGHTGSGKTHTIFGYPKDNVPGIYQLFARNILNDIRITNNKDIFIEIRFTELYQNKIKDLLSATKSECFVREDERGEIHLRAQPIVCDDDKIRAFPITGIRVQTEDELLDVICDGIASRNVGSSSLHDKSSRSHAFLEFELVSTALIKQRNDLIEKEADILNHEMMVDTLKMSQYKDEEVLAALGEKKLKMVEGLGITDIMRLRDEIAVMKKEVTVMKNTFADDERAFVGGTMVFVDLAGNEYGRDVKNRNIEEERERNDINKSLLSLKECIRGLHKNKDYIGYRNSKLTMYLRKYLRGKGSKAVMISNIGSSQTYAKQTINTLQYTQLVAKA